MTDNRFERAIALIDEANAPDPVTIEVDGRPAPKELTHARMLTAWVERRTGRGPVPCTIAATTVVALVSLPAVLAHNLWAEGSLFGIDLMTVYDFLPFEVLLPLGGLLIAVFVGWRVGADTARTELALASPRLFLAWRWLLRYVATPAVLLIFLFGLLG